MQMNEINLFSEPGGFERAKDVMHRALALAQQTNNLDNLHNSLSDALTQNIHPTFRPYVFATAARSLLQDPRNWVKSDGKFKRINSSTIEKIDVICNLRQVIDDKNNYYFDIVRGITCFSSDPDIQMNVENAFRHFASASRYPDFYRIVKDDFGGGASFARTFPTETDLHFTHGRKFVSELVLPAPPAGLNFAFSVHVDRLYAQAFSEHWIAAIRNLNKVIRCGLHLHVIHRNNDRRVLDDQLRLLASDLGDLFLLTHEEAQKPERAYFASSRIIYGASILQSFKCPVIFVDADAEISDIDDFGNNIINRMLNVDKIIGLLSFGPWQGFLPWRRFSAGWLYVPPTSEGSRFLRMAGNMVDYFWDDRPGRCWWIDQMALEAALLRLRFDDQGGEAVAWEHLFPTAFRAFGDPRKLAALSSVPEISELIASGINVWQAMHQLNSAVRPATIPP
jgi:hypothetical protein